MTNEEKLKTTPLDFGDGSFTKQTLMNLDREFLVDNVLKWKND